jgi:hypothetical protein
MVAGPLDGAAAGGLFVTVAAEADAAWPGEGVSGFGGDVFPSVG